MKPYAATDSEVEVDVEEDAVGILLDASER